VNAAPTLRGDGVVLRPLLLSDAPALFAALSDGETQRFRRANAHETVVETGRYIADTLERSRAAWAITVDNDEALGRLALREPQAGVGEFGIVIRRAAQGRGLGAKAITLAAGWAFATLAMSKLCADIDAENAASIALFTRCGFTQEAYLSGHRTTKLGLRDSVILAKHRS
jgi:[ribosomal protein S5]-alanine N-acetyltransferase